MRRAGAWALLLCLTACLSWAAAQSERGSKKKAAVPPPEWKKSVRDAFFADATKKLQGERPDFGSAPQAGSSGGSDAPGDEGGGEGDGFAWSTLIDAETMENEIKAGVTAVAGVIGNPSKFKGGTYKDARLRFSMSAVMLGIIANYDGEVRWKEKAAGLRDEVAKAGFNCKVGTDQSLNEAKLRHEDLSQLLSGGSVSVPDPQEDITWPKVTDRSPLMQRMEIAAREHLLPWTANSSDFGSNKEEALSEAQILAVLTRIIQDPGYEFAEDDSYLGYAKELESASLEVIQAVKDSDFNKAQQAMSRANKACDDCHNGFRG